MAKIYGDEKGDKAQWAKLKGAPLKDKVEFFFTYYWVHTLAVVIGLIFVISITTSIIRNSKPVVISAEFQGTVMREDAGEDLHAVLADRLGLNMKKTRIDITSSVFDTANYEQRSAQTQKIFARLATGDMDILGAAEPTFQMYMDPTDIGGCAFADLREILDEKTVSVLESEGRLVYFEMDDGTRFPYLIKTDDSYFYEFFGFILEDYYIGCCVTSQHQDAIREAISYLMIEN